MSSSDSVEEIVMIMIIVGIIGISLGFLVKWVYKKHPEKFLDYMYKGCWIIGGISFCIGAMLAWSLTA